MNIYIYMFKSISTLAPTSAPPPSAMTTIPISICTTSFPLAFFFFFLLFFFSLTHASPVYDAALLMHPVSRKSVVEALVALPDVTRLLAGLSTNERVPSPYLRVDVRTTNSNDNLSQLTISSDGNYLIIDKNTRAQLPVRADPDTRPTVVRSPSKKNNNINNNNGRITITIVVRTLSARISACKGAHKCLTTILTTVCPPIPHKRRINISMKSALEECVNTNTNTNTNINTNTNNNNDNTKYYNKGTMMKKKRYMASFSKFATVFYRFLFTILTLAQLGVLVWGAAFSISYIAGEIGDATYKMSRKLYESCTWIHYLLSFSLLTLSFQQDQVAQSQYIHPR